MADDKSRSRDSEFRKRRVQRIKKIIVTTVIILLVLPTILTIFLMVKVFHLQGQVDDIMTERAQSQVGETVNDRNQASAGIEPDLVTAAAVTGSAASGTGNTVTTASKGKVYLTFDDGPGTQTEKILDILKKEKVKATFFVTGKEDSYSKKMYKRIVKEGHTLGMHSFSNKYSTIYASTEAFEQDFDKISSYLKDVTGVNSLYYRFPGGSSNEISNVNMAEFVRVLNEKGITYFDWNVSAGDTSSDYTVDDVVTNVTEGVKRYKTSVVLLHDGDDKSTTVEALEPLIQKLQQMKAEILPIDENTKVIQYIKADSVE